MPNKSLSLVVVAAVLAAGAASTAVACSSGAVAVSGGADAGVTPDASVVLPFQADPPAVYVAKVKNILVGLAPTDDEIKTVTADPSSLGGLIDGWMALPQYTQKMETFFELAFQQTQISDVDFSAQMTPIRLANNAFTTPKLLQNARESFARTALALVAEGRPFDETMTTHRLMMTPALMELYAFLDVYQVDDAEKVTDLFAAQHRGLTLTVEAAQGPIPIADTLNPASPSYMHWYDPDVTSAAARSQTECGADPFVYPASARALHLLLYGSIDQHKSAAGTCLTFGGTAVAPQVQPDDFTAWKMVTLRPPAAGETVTPFYDLPALRAATALVLKTPRVGFFTTPAFFANWQTNQSNQMRVTINQALIVATGSFVDGTDPTLPAGTPGLDAVHAAPGTACFSCHATLDPLRSILAATYSWSYHAQNDPSYVAQKGIFAYRGVTAPVANIDDLASQLAHHPLFATAWTEKLCYYVNSAPCAADDPELQRVVGVFESSGHSWNALVHELLASPLTTNVSETRTTATGGEVVAVTRRDHLCAALDARLGLSDVCGLDALNVKKLKSALPPIVSGLPSDGYGRGSSVPVLPNQPTLFFRAGTENICEGVAALVIDPGAPPAGAKRWSSADPGAAIADFVATVMALTPSDPRSAPAAALLSDHFASAVQSGVSATDALRSTFTVACLSPSAIGIGM
jgi:hypothetical protein